MVTLWSLYNTVEKLQIDDLKSEQVRIVLLSIPTVRMRDWMICKKGEVHWQSLLQIPEFFDDVRDLKGDTSTLIAGDLSDNPGQKKGNPAPEVRRPLFEDVSFDDVETLSIMGPSKTDVKERRSARRYTRQLKFEVIQGGKTFETTTVDISMTGMSLKEELPDWVKAQFPAVISLGEKRLNLRVARLSGKKDSSKIKVVDAEQWDVLKSWIANW